MLRYTALHFTILHSLKLHYATQHQGSLCYTALDFIYILTISDHNLVCDDQSVSPNMYSQLVYKMVKWFRKISKKLKSFQHHFNPNNNGKTCLNSRVVQVSMCKTILQRVALWEHLYFLQWDYKFLCHTSAAAGTYCIFLFLLAITLIHYLFGMLAMCTALQRNGNLNRRFTKIP